MSASNLAASTFFQPYNQKHCVEIMKHMNAERKLKKNSCDGMLQVEGIQYPVHKGIVGAVSEFLKTMFNAEMREKYENVVQISKMTHAALGNILEYIYTGFMTVTPDNVLDLLEGAEYMQIDGLKSNCKDYLVESTSVENCLKFRAYGQRYNLDELCDATDNVVAENFSDVIQHEDFNELDKDMVSELINSRKVKTCEETLFTSIVRWVNHNADQRQELFVELFCLVDFSSLSETFLNDNVLLEPLVSNSLQCYQRLFNRSGPIRVYATNSDRKPTPEVNADKFVVIGGGQSEKKCVTYDLKGKHPLRMPELNVKRCAATAVKIKHRVYVAGGGDHSYLSSYHQSAEVLDLQNPKKWVKIADMLEGRQYAASAVSNGRMVVTGGSGGINNSLRSCEIYNCELNLWFPMKAMLEARWCHDMTSLNGLLYCVGGSRDFISLKSAECYDEKIGEWKEIASMPTARNGLAVIALNGFIYAIGGCDRLYLNKVERYSPETNTWTKRANLNVARYLPGVCVMNGRIYVIGGSDSNNSYSKSVEVYDEAEDKWEICFDMDAAAHTSAVVAF